MNDLATIDLHGPAPTPPSDAALRAARARLDSAVAQVDDGVQHSPRWRRSLLAAAAVAAAALAIAVTPALVGSDRSVVLAEVDPMTFPWTAGAMPAGLGRPVFEKDSNFLAVRYGGRSDRVSITTNVADEDFWTIPADAEPAVVGGEQGRVYERVVYTGTPERIKAVTVVWNDDAHDWTAVTGSGRYADAEQVIAVARTLEDKPQRVRLSLGVAPAGWSVAAYKEDRIVSLSGPGEDDDMTVSLVDRVGSNLAGYGAWDESAVTINGRPALVGRQDSDQGAFCWVVEASTASGQSFSLRAPGHLTRDQVVDVAEGVTYRE